MYHPSPIPPAKAGAQAKPKAGAALTRAWIPAFAGTIGVLGAFPALAHEEHEHGLPGALHPLSADHLGWVLLAAVVLLVAFALRRPIVRALKVRGRK